MLSEHGQAYARTQTYYGRDVAEFIPEFDDVLAYNVRAAFMKVLNAEPEPDEAQKHLAAVRRSQEVAVKSYG